jgi:hypothetical protein
MDVIILLTTAGADTGPFSIYTNSDGFTTPVETNVPKSSLTTPPGHLVTIPNDATIVRVCSNNPVCTNCIDLAVPSGTTTTTTTTSTTTTTNPCSGCPEYGPTGQQQCINVGGIDYNCDVYHDGCCGTVFVNCQEGACP